MNLDQMVEALTKPPLKKKTYSRTISFKRLETMIERAYALAGQVIDDNRDEQSLQVLAEEVSGECGEFLALWNKDYGAFGDTDCMDSELVGLVEKLKKGE